MSMKLIYSGGNNLYLQNKFLIIIFSILLLAGGGTLGFLYFQKGEPKETIEAQKSVENENIEKAIVDAESKVISAEMNPIQANIDAAEEAVALISKGKEKQELIERVSLVKEEFARILREKEESHIKELRGKIDQAKIDLGIAELHRKRDC